MGTTNLHNSRPLIVFENKRSFYATRRHHNALRPNLHIAFIKGIFFAAHTQGGDVIVAIETDHGCVRENPNMRMALHFIGQFSGSTIQRYIWAVFCCAVIKETPQPGTTFQKDHTKPLFSRGQGRHDTRRPTSNDTDLCIDILFIKTSFHSRGPIDHS